MSRTIKIHNFDQTEDQINRLSRELQAARNQATQARSDARHEAQQIADQRVRQLKIETENRFNNTINDLQRQIERAHDSQTKERMEAEARHQEALKKQSNDFYSKLQSEISGVKDWTQGRINTLQDTVNRQIQNQQSQINDVRQQVRNLYEKEADAETRAKNLIADVLDRLNRAKNSQHQKYMPGRLNQIINQVQRLTNSTDPAAARIANAQTALNEIWNLEDDVARAQAQFETLRQIVLQEADTIILEMSKNRNVTARNEEGEAAELEINFWTNGTFNKLENETKDLKQELEKKKDAIELDEKRLKAILSRLTDIEVEQNKLREETIRKGLESERRIEISEDIVEAMLQEGFILQGENKDAHNYMGGEEPTDAREGVFAVLKDANGTEITVIVNTNDDSRTQVVFQRNDAKPRTEAEFRRGLDEIKKKVQDISGIDLGASNPISGVGDNRQSELIDPKKLAREGIAKDVKKRLGLN